MKSTEVFVFFKIATLLITVSAMPDSAGVVEMVNGLAYGGIPYGSVSGRLADYDLHPDARSYYSQPQRRNQPPTTVIVTPNYRAPGVEARRNGPVQIYQLPGVIAPGIVGTISQIGY